MNVKEGFVEAEGHRLAFLAVNGHLDDGTGPAIVFIHGVLASANFWRDCAPPDFRENRAWYALSLPAHHPSGVPGDFAPEQVDAQWFFRVMNGALQGLLGQRKAIIVGHSTGGFCGLNLAAHQAPNVAGVVSIGGFYRGRWGGVEGLLLRMAGWGPWARSLFVSSIGVARKSRWVRRVFASLLAADRKAWLASPLSERMLDNLEADSTRQDAQALYTLFRGIGGIDIADTLRRIRVPCHILAGTDDPVITAAQSLVLAAEIPTARLTVFRNVGHMPFMECTATFFDVLEGVLAELERTDP